MLHPLHGGAGRGGENPGQGIRREGKSAASRPGTLGSEVHGHSPQTANSEPPEARRTSTSEAGWLAGHQGKREALCEDHLLPSFTQ